MNAAAEAFSADLAAAGLRAPTIPVYANRTAQPYGGDVPALLTAQLRSPVLWEKSVHNMISTGADTFLELGPGRTLCGLIAKTDASVRVYPAGEAEGLEKILTEAALC